MKVEDVMTVDVKTCSTEDSLNRAAQLMWEGDLGIVPVVDSGKCAVGVITDRDITMAAYTKGLPLSAIRVGDVMAKEVFGCSPKDSVQAAMGAMGRWRVRRLAVLDRQRRLLGILSLHDLVRRNGGEELVKTLAAVCTPWMAAPRRETRTDDISTRQADIEC